MDDTKSQLRLIEGGREDTETDHGYHTYPIITVGVVIGFWGSVAALVNAVL